MQNSSTIKKSSPIVSARSRHNNQEFDVYEFKNGIYQGDFNDFKREGYGIYMWDDGQIYIGEWKDDLMEGMGIIFLGFGGYIYGKFLRNKLHGPGILTFPNGDIIACGNWEAGKLTERCIKFNNAEKKWQNLRYLYTVYMEGMVDNDKITKEFQEIKENILRSSKTLFEYKEYFYSFPYTKAYKERNFGNCKSAPPKCIDFLTNQDESWYFGMTLNGIPNGLGILGSKKQIQFRGVFEAGKLNGIGRSELPNGDIYDGVFLNGDLSIGFVYKKNEERFIYGSYEKGCLKNELKTGKGFPFNMLSACKHNIYMVNMSYYYRYTAIEVIYLHELGKQISSLYPYVRTKSKKRLNSPKRTEKIKQKQPPSKDSSSPTKNKTSHSPSRTNENDEFNSTKCSPMLKEEPQSHFVPKETDRESSLHRKSLSVERSKYSEMLPESPQKDLIKKCTFNDDTPKKVSLPPKESLLQTNNKNEKVGIDQVINEKKPTNLEYNAFVNSPNYYNEKLEEIMQDFHENGELGPDEEKPVGKVNTLQLKKSFEGPPSFGELPDDKNNLHNRHSKDVNREHDKKIQRSSMETIKENYKNNGSDPKNEMKKGDSKGELKKSDIGLTKNALIIYYDDRKGPTAEQCINLNEYDCRYYNLCHNKIERPALHIHEKQRLEVDSQNN